MHWWSPRVTDSQLLPASGLGVRIVVNKCWGEGKEDKCGGQGQLFPYRGPSEKKEAGSFYQVTTLLYRHELLGFQGDPYSL